MTTPKDDVYKTAQKTNKKQDIIIRFGQMYVQNLMDVLEDFKALMDEEIEQIIQTDKLADGGFDNHGLSARPNGKTVVQKNVPNVRNLEKGLLKRKGHEKVVEADENENLPAGLSTIHPAHENFNMVFNIMLGIKKAVDSTLDLSLLKATEKDFHLRCQYEIAPYRTDSGDSVKACTFFDYAPQIFA